MDRIHFDGYPNSQAHPFYKTSNQNWEYNCIAWVLGVEDKWYEPPGKGPKWPVSDHYWPNGIPTEMSAEAYMRLFELYGFKKCKDCKPEKGQEKIAFWYDGLLPRRPHAARLCSDGYWTSKMGKDEDVKHALETLKGGRFGEVRYFLKRPLGWKPRRKL